jgi:hypothetical protein
VRARLVTQRGAAAVLCCEFAEKVVVAVIERVRELVEGAPAPARACDEARAGVVAMNRFPPRGRR